MEHELTIFQDPQSLNLIVLHLGSGASACAIREGKSLDTSMGLTPLNGLPGATRSGAIDPSLIFHFTNKAGSMSHDPKMSREIHVTEVGSRLIILSLHSAETSHFFRQKIF